MRRLFLALAFILAGCSSAPFAASLKASDGGYIDFPAGQYRVTWDSGSCSNLFVEITPTNGTPRIPVTISGPAGSAVVTVPEGRAHVDRGGSCPKDPDYTVTITRQ